MHLKCSEALVEDVTVELITRKMERFKTTFDKMSLYYLDKPVKEAVESGEVACYIYLTSYEGKTWIDGEMNSVYLTNPDITNSYKTKEDVRKYIKSVPKDEGNKESWYGHLPVIGVEEALKGVQLNQVSRIY